MLLTLAYLHSHDVVHRDLRLEKWVFASQAGCTDTTERTGTLGVIKLVDLGSAKHWTNKKKTMNAACGTLPYASPGKITREKDRRRWMKEMNKKFPSKGAEECAHLSSSCSQDKEI